MLFKRIGNTTHPDTRVGKQDSPSSEVVAMGALTGSVGATGWVSFNRGR